MSVSSSRDLVQALKLASHADDETFDASLDRLIERARSEAEPPPSLQPRVEARLRLEARLRTGPSQPAPLRSPLAFRAAHPSPVRAWLRGLALLASGVVIGVAWSRAPFAWPLGGEDRIAPASASTPVSPAADSTPAPDPGLAPPTGIPSLRLALEHLRRAQLQLRERSPEGALATLAALDARVAADVLAEERVVTRALALCDLGDATAARALAGHLLERAHASAYAASLRESCVGKLAAPASAPARGAARSMTPARAGGTTVDRSQLLDEMRRRSSNPPRGSY